MKGLSQGGWRLQWVKVSRQRTDLRAGARVAYPGRGGSLWGTIVAAGPGWNLVLSRLKTPYNARLQRV